jgi:hypothetical protein
MNTGSILSGIGHAGLILWVILGDWLFQAQESPPVAVTDVSIMSEAEFAALTAEPAPVVETATEVVQPAPVAPDPVVPEVPAVVAEDPPPPDPPPAPLPDQPPAPEPAPVPEPVTEPVPNPEPDPVPEPDPLPVAADPVEASVRPLTPDVKPRPKPADVIAPDPVDAPEVPTEVAPEIVPEVVETPDPVEPEVQEPVEAAAPENTGDVIRTEENATDTPSQLAPASSARPLRRPEQPAPSEEPAVAETPAEPAPETPTDPATDQAALDAALAEAQAAEETPAQPAGPPMTGSEKDAMRVAVSTCWNVGSLSSAALETEVTLGLTVAQNGVPDAGSIRMLGFTGGTEAGAQQAYEAARRAIIRCGARGFPLPPEKYDQWRELELTFDPSGMRMR